MFYVGLREESEKIKKIKKEVKIEESIFRISKKPAQITEEEVTYYKERKICLVCKGKAVKFIYICQKCDALYCLKCANALSSLENQCWACNAPIDESKPSKPYDEEEEIAIEEDIEKKGKRFTK